MYGNVQLRKLGNWVKKYVQTDQRKKFIHECLRSTIFGTIFGVKICTDKALCGVNLLPKKSLELCPESMATFC
jgi:hypothetical protein